jgi:hypothetical protein
MLGFSSAANFALGMLAEDRIPNEFAIALSPTVGWLLLACAVCVYALFVLQSERWRRFFLTLEDPRPIALFRIVFAFLCICNINDVFEYFEFLFTDEGIFLSDAARQLVASGQFKGFGDGIGDDPYGFFDAAGWVEYLKGQKYSLLYFWDTPRAMWAQVLLFYAICTAFMVGYKTRVTGFLSFMLMNSFFLRNHLFWEGTELVYRVFFFYLILARSGHAYSVDNWLRCRKLRRQGLLSEPGKPGAGAGAPPSPAHPQGLQAVYRLIPTWPRMLMLLNLGVLYCYTGTVKNGAVWAKGDALYYAINMDHFHRFYPQELSTIVAMNAFRVATWVTHWWEALFPFMVLGVITRWGHREGLEPLRGWRLWATRACWLGLGLGAMAVCLVAAPVHAPPAQVRQLTLALTIGWPILIVLLGGLWWGLGTGRMRLRVRGNLYVLDREWFCKWFLGRRVWLTLGLFFHGNLQVLMNIGMFPPIMMSTYLFCLSGDEPGRILRLFGRGLTRLVPALPRRSPFWAGVDRGDGPLPAEDRTLPHHRRDGRRLPTALIWLLLALAALGVFLQAGPLVPWLKQHWLGYDEAAATGGLHFGWTVVAIAVIVLVATYVQGHRGTRLFGLKVAALVAALGAYLWMMGRTVEDPVAAEAWMFTKIGVNLALVAVLALQQIPAVHRVLARVGLTFHDPRRRPAVPDLPTHEPHTPVPRAPWAYGPGGRMLVGFVIVYHITAIAFWELPEKDVVSTFRIKGREAFTTWVLTTQTDQQWGMFAPNPPRHNVFMRVVMTDENGETWDLRNDVYAPERHPIPWYWNDRMRKMNRRVIGGESGKGDWYQKWYARYICREWARTHRGVMPQKVELFKLSYKMPAPETVVQQGWYWPEELLVATGKEEREYSEKCSTAIHGQLPNFIRERHGIPLLDDKTFKPWVKSKKKTWDRRLEPPASKTDPKTARATSTRTPASLPGKTAAPVAAEPTKAP